MTARQSILPLFPLLASHDQTTRLDASLSLLDSLPLPTPPPHDPDTPYALKRLIAGLASSNESARQGFAVALAQLLSTLPDDLAARVLPQFEESTNTSRSGLDPREERDLLFAKLVGSHAFVRSGILVRPEGLAANRGESWKQIVQGLVSLANKKSWIREPSYWVICQAIDSLIRAPGSDWKQDTIDWAVQRLINDAREKAKGWGPDKVAVVLTLEAHQIDADYKTILAPTFPSGSLLSRSSLPSLAQALRGALQSASNPFGASSSSKTPRQGSNAVKTSKNSGAPAPGQNPHFVWNLILDNYFSADAKPQEGRASWDDFWKVCVDDSLFGSPSLPLKALGFSLVQSTLPLLPPAHLTTLFGPSTLRVFANHLRKSHSVGSEEKTLAKVTEKLAYNSIPAYLTEHPQAVLPLLRVLTSPPNSHPGAFENKFLEKLVAKLPISGVKGWVESLKTLFLTPPESLVSAPTTTTISPETGDLEHQTEEEDAKSLEASKDKRVLAIRTWSLDQMLHVARNGGVVKDDEVLRTLTEFLAVVGWFDIKKESDSGARSYVAEPRLSIQQRQAARSRFFSVLTALVSAPAATAAAAAAAASPATASVATGSVWLSRAFATLENLAKDTKHFSLASDEAQNDDDDEEQEEVATLKTRCKEMYDLLAKSGKKDSQEDKNRRKVARSLIEGVLLVAWEENQEALEVLEQLSDLLPMLFPTLLSAYKAEDEDVSMDEDDEIPEPTTVLVSLLLSLLQRPSAFVKAVSAEVVEGFAAEMGQQAVGLLLETIAPIPEEADAEEDAEEEEVASAVSTTSKGKKAAPAPADEEDDEDDEDDDDEDSDDDEVDEKFREELLKALEAGGLAPLNDHDGADDEDEDEESEEELLDDEAMMELDDKLADIFRANGGGRKNKKRDRTDDLHYRLRLLDLLEVLARKQPSSALLVPAFVPLLNLARSTAPLEIELRNKASKLIRFLVQPRKAADSITPAEPDSALEALEEVHALAQGVEISEFAPIVAQTAVALAKIALASPAADATTSKAVSTLFADSFAQYLSTKNARTKVQPLLTTEFSKRTPAAAWGMFDQVVQLARGQVEGDKKATVNAFRRMQAFEVAQTLIVSNFNLKTPESKAAVLAGIPTYQQALHEALSTSFTASPTTATFDAARLKQLVKHALASARLTVQMSKGGASEAAERWSVPAWIELVDQARSNERFKGAVAVQTLLKQLVSVLGGSIASSGNDAKKKTLADKKRKLATTNDEATPKKVKAQAQPTGMNEVEVEVEMDEDDEVNPGAVAAGTETGSTTKGTPNGKKDKKDKKKRRRSEGGDKA
ncbi:uncharacterized protein JCM15063_000657 [Sporobolomyces koalae]|uniref:uncharacterized protein n=1 Tax=Sporobolomyces koalae TaxID=500713 RepID=UPI00316C4CB5